MNSNINPGAVEALKPCPFCGGPANSEYAGEWGRYDTWIVKCGPCDISLDEGPCVEGRDKARLAAESAWNTRATPAPASEQEDFDRHHIERLHRLQHDGTAPAAKPEWGSSIIGWAADEIIALRALSASKP